MTFEVSNERQRMTGCVPSYNYEPSVGRRSERILDFFVEAPADFLFTDNFLHCPSIILQLFVFSSYATQILILQWGLSAREEIQPGDCFDIVGLSPGKPFCSATKGVLDLEPLAPRLKHLI